MENQLGELFTHYDNMYELKTLELTSSYRDDENGRPCAYLVGPYLFVRTHPFYIWGDVRKNQVYGRAYKYEVMLESQVSKNDETVPKAFLKALVTDMIDTLYEFYASPEIFNGLLEKLDQGGDFTHNSVTFTQTDFAGYQQVYKSMADSKLTKPVAGCVEYQKQFWILSLLTKPDWDAHETPTYSELRSLDEYFRSKEIIIGECEYENGVFLCDTNVRLEIGRVYSNFGEITIAYLTAHRN